MTDLCQRPVYGETERNAEESNDSKLESAVSVYSGSVGERLAGYSHLSVLGSKKSLCRPLVPYSKLVFFSNLF